MRFQLLGPVEVRDDTAGVVELSACKTRTVLAMLLLARNRVVPDSRIAEMLWGDQPPATAAAQIQTYVSRLRQKLGPSVPITRQQPGYLLQVRPDRLDLAEFERLAGRGRKEADDGRWEEAAASLRAALSMWQGPSLTGVTDILGEAQRPQLEEARIAVLEDRVEADLALGRHADLVPELAGLVSNHPLREQLRGQLISALASCGRQADALASYQCYRDLLADELGIGPGPELRELHQHILLAHPVPEVPVQRAGAQAKPAAWLPPDLSDFTGRARELARVLELLHPADEHHGRRVGCVVTGMAGVGKSALAVHAAHRLRALYPDGQVHLDVAGTPSFDLLGQLLGTLEGTAAELPDSLEERVRRYRAGLDGRRVLVVLDNVTDERQIRPLLPDSPRCGVLVTSRARLAALDGVPMVELGVLGTEDAVLLLGKLIGAVRMGAELAAAKDIVGHCGRLPLAVRIAGGKLAAKPHWRLALLAERLRRADRRLDELRLADLEVRGILAHSLRDLSEAARTAFRVLGALDVSGFSVRAASAALGVPEDIAHDLVEHLLDARLLEVGYAPDGHEVRYHFHELVRAVARESGPVLTTVLPGRAGSGRLIAP